jgi:ABC-type uncharacterized transport system permease subunit
VLREELKRAGGWEERHRRLIGRLLLILIATLVIDAIGTVLLFLAERHAHETDVHTFGDAFFFTTYQLLTVSSSMNNPLSTLGRSVNILLEAWGVLVIAGAAGAFASFLQDAEDS